MSYIQELLPKMIQYRLARYGIAGPGMPINLTFSVTNICQSRCKTCNIWELYKNNPQKRQTELTLAEINTIFQSMGHVYVFNISGGEPFLRGDLPQIIESACRYLTPGIIHIPTNAIAIRKIRKQVAEILDLLETQFPTVRLTIKPSLDHIGEKHDEIRGVPGNFEKVMELFHYLKQLQAEHKNLHAELGTVISCWNVGEIEIISEYVSQLGADSYRNEIAEQRSEMFNQENPITPSPDDYEKAIAFFVKQLRTNMKNKVFFQRITNSFRLIYYDLAIETMREKRQIIPCYAGISNAHMTPYGDIWACCTLGYEKSMGNLRDHDYDFKSLWNSRQAKKVRNDIRSGSCHCPLANQTYSNILLHGPSLTKVLWEIFKKQRW
ncbi:MAG: radical SAM protein [Desulfobacteraceae bacterium]|nr:MAG: radical SAM protein [Desulfobacteraceae bacterium]